MQRILSLKTKFAEELREIAKLPPPASIGDDVLSFSEETEFFQWRSLPGRFARFVQGEGRTMAVATGTQQAVLSELSEGFLSKRHVHKSRKESFHVLKGRIRLTVFGPDGEKEAHEIKKGESFHVRAGTPHELLALKKSQCVFSWS